MLDLLESPFSESPAEPCEPQQPRSIIVAAAIGILFYYLAHRAV